MTDEAREGINETWRRRQLNAYDDVTRRPWLLGVSAAIAVCVLVFVLCYGIFALHWLFASKSVNKLDQTLQHSYGNQTSYIQALGQDQQAILELTSQIATDPGAKQALQAQRAAAVNDYCFNAAKIDQIPSSFQSFTRTNCVAGAMSSTSPYFVHSN